MALITPSPTLTSNFFRLLILDSHGNDLGCRALSGNNAAFITFMWRCTDVCKLFARAGGILAVPLDDAHAFTEILAHQSIFPVAKGILTSKSGDYFQLLVEILGVQCPSSSNLGFLTYISRKRRELFGDHAT